jgi:hypothetical protein
MLGMLLALQLQYVQLCSRCVMPFIATKYINAKFELISKSW